MPSNGEKPQMNEFIVNGYTRPRHWETIYHDIADLYGPKIRLDGIGLWFTYKRFVQHTPGHLLEDKAWPSARDLLANLFHVGQTSLRNTRQRLEATGLITATSGRDLTASSTITMSDLAAIGIQNPAKVLIIEVNDPLTLHPFCEQFSLTYSPVRQGRQWEMEFDDYSGIIRGPNRLLAAVRWIEDNLAVNPTDRPYRPLVTEEQINSLLRCNLDDAETIELRQRLLNRRAQIAGEALGAKMLPNDVLANLSRLGWVGSTAVIETAYRENPHRVKQVIQKALVMMDSLRDPAGFIHDTLSQPYVKPPQPMEEMEEISY